ncbi:MAG: UbiD family decarboxylase [Desulfonatronovibrionaceae bacterium]
MGGYLNLRQCVEDLRVRGELLKIDARIDPYLEAGAIQRRVFRAGGPALLFANVRGTPFPMLGNLFGTASRLRFIFRHSLPALKELMAVKFDPLRLFSRPLNLFRLPPALYHALPGRARTGPAAWGRTTLSALPGLVSWPGDGGAYVTLPQVYSEDPENPGYIGSNMGMYRVQLTGNRYVRDREAGLHYQIHRGIGAHHAKSLKRGEGLAVNVFVGGPPAMTLAAVMPLPEGVPEIMFAGVLAGRRIKMIRPDRGLPFPAEADFCIRGRLLPAENKPEGPFGDHLGYYSLRHDFPVLRVDEVLHRKDAIWPFTTVGRPPQEDTVLGDFIHELTAPLVSEVFSGVREIHAVDAAGVHPLLLAVARESYVPFAVQRQPQEILTCALSLLGRTQTSLSKYVLIAAQEDDPGLSPKNMPMFFKHVLERIDLDRDIHFFTRTTMDTLDYSGISLNQGSKAVWAVAGGKKRRLGLDLPRDLRLPSGFGRPVLFAPGIIVIQGPGHSRPRDSSSPEMAELGRALAEQPGLEGFPLLVVADDSSFCASGWDNFLWTVFTRSDPASDSYGAGEFMHCKHWSPGRALIIDARLKTYHAPPLKDDPQVEKRVDRLGEKGGPLHGII